MIRAVEKFLTGSVSFLDVLELFLARDLILEGRKALKIQKIEDVSVARQDRASAS